MRKLKLFYKKFSRYLTSIVINDEKRQLVMSETIYAAFAVISLVMSVLNVITMRIPLLIATASFFVLSVVDYVVVRLAPRLQRITQSSFEAGVMVLFSYFIITGGTDNFSIIWLLLMPTLGLFFFGIKSGSMLSAAILVIMLLFFYVSPFTEICTDYGDTFRMRFPIVYIACYLVSLLLEYIRVLTARELSKVNREFRYLYRHDVLTGVSNRYSVDEHFNEAVKNSSGKVGILMFDIDFFKNVNDTYGHKVGDSVLKEMCTVVKGVSPDNTSIHRWGGEEFVIITPQGEEVVALANKIHDAVNSNLFDADGKKISVTISIGTICTDIANNYPCDALIEKADANLYAAKNNGRNCVVSTEV